MSYERDGHPNVVFPRGREAAARICGVRPERSDACTVQDTCLCPVSQVRSRRRKRRKAYESRLQVLTRAVKTKWECRRDRSYSLNLQIAPPWETSEASVQ
eukprot:1350903-Pleurochrysis_carterae.AAC.1